MTRDEQLEHSITVAKARLARLTKQREQRRARDKEMSAKARNAQYWRVGKMADDAGLLVLDEGTLGALFLHLTNQWC